MKTMTLVKTVSIAIFGFTMTATSLSAADHDHSGHVSEESHAYHMLEDYTAVANALYKDNLAIAKKIAAGVAEHDKKSSLAAPAKEISEAKSIEEARKAFNALSAAAITIAKKEKGFKVAHCPMANGNKGGDWLQNAADKKVNNPYFGAKMPHCGSFKK